MACPEGLIDDANALLTILGNGPADGNTFAIAAWSDASGQPYALASWLADRDFEALASAPLLTPDWTCDMPAALRAQERLIFAVSAVPDRITAVFDAAPDAAIQHLGLTPLETD
jgi:hypothetical protein